MRLPGLQSIGPLDSGLTLSPEGRISRPAIVAALGFVLATALAVRILADFGWNATAFVGFGEEASATREYAEDRLGEVLLRASQGHDGKFFFVQANDPWVIEPGVNAEILDFPVHRSRRMVYPLVAGGFGLLGPDAIVWGLLVANVLGMAFGTWGTARLAVTLGGSPWWGLAFALNIGLMFDLIIDGAGILALAFAIWGTTLLNDRHLKGAIAFLALSALTREVMILCAVGVAVWLWTGRHKRHALFAFGLPALALGLWELYLRVRLGPDTGERASLGLPLAGLGRAVIEWWHEPIVAVFGITVLALTGIYAYRWWVGRSLLAWAFVGFVPLATLFTAAIWIEFFDFTRALAPLLTAAILVVFVEKRSAVVDQPKSQRIQGSREPVGND